MEPKMEPKVELATKDDVDAISELMADAFLLKYNHAGMSKEQATTINRMDYEMNGDWMLNRCGVVREPGGNRVVGMCQLKYGDNERVNVGSWGDYTKRLGMNSFQMFRMLKLATLETKVHKGECMVHMLCVNADYHGHGIGGTLLKWAEQQAIAHKSTSIVLHVARSNQARRLYERHGFVTEDKWLTNLRAIPDKLICGEAGFYHMRKNLGPDLPVMS